VGKRAGRLRVREARRALYILRGKQQVARRRRSDWLLRGEQGRMVSKLFQQTAGGALVVGIVFALVDLEYFVPGLFFGAVAALLTFGIRDPQQSVLDILKKETDTNIFKAFIEDLFSRIDQVGVPPQ
jgi:hypothetical protein